jgi:hypothetical protein
LTNENHVKIVGLALVFARVWDCDQKLPEIMGKHVTKKNKQEVVTRWAFSIIAMLDNLHSLCRPQKEVANTILRR